MFLRWRIIDTGPRDSFTNMAFDEALLRGYSFHGSPPTFRIYGWEPRALSIGYSQVAERDLDIEFCRRRSIHFVRRITGGGIISHADELTYSLVCSKSDLGVPERVVSSYRVISSFLITFYKRLGLDAAFACDSNSGESDHRPAAPSALCFASKEKYDIIINGRKIGGSAQKRSGDIIFQHGSIPLGAIAGKYFSFLRNGKTLSLKKQATCLEELLGRPLKFSELSGPLADSFKATFDLAMDAGRLSATEEQLLADLVERKYKSREWNYNRMDPTMVNDDHTYRSAVLDK